MFDHVTIRATDREASEVHDEAAVDAFHRAATGAARCEGAHVLDPDGNAVEVVCHGSRR